MFLKYAWKLYLFFDWQKSEYKLFTLCDIYIFFKCELCCVILWDNCEKKEEKPLLVNYWSNFVAAGRVIFCSSVIMSLCRVLTEMFYWIWWSARTWLKPMQTFEMNENSDCQPDHITQHQCLISLMLMFKLEWIPTAMFQHLLEHLPRRAGADQPSIKPSGLKSNTQQAHRGVLFGCPHAFVHIMYRGSSNSIAID